MTTPLLERAWPACLSALQLDRWMTGELRRRDSDFIRAHLSICQRCAGAADAMRAERDALELPRLRLLSIAPTISLPDDARPARAWKIRTVAAVAGLAAAASLLLLVHPTTPGERIKGTGFSLTMYVQHGGEVRRVGPGEAIAPGDAVRFAVATPIATYLAVMSVDARGRASIYYPATPFAQPVRAGDDTPLPLGTRLDDTVGEERIVGLFCSSPIALEPVRARLQQGSASFPNECHVTQWTFVKR